MFTSATIPFLLPAQLARLLLSRDYFLLSFTPHIHKILRLTACIYRILPRFDQPCCGIIFVLMASLSPLPSHLQLAVGVMLPQHPPTTFRER